MSNGKNDFEALRDRFFQSLQQGLRGRHTKKQKEFFNLPGITSEGSLYVMKHRGATAWLSARGEGVHLEMISTQEPQRGEGHASELLRRICSLADEVEVTLSLRAEPKARKIGLRQAKLVEWYRRNGFEGEWDKMTRLPRATGSRRPAINVGPAEQRKSKTKREGNRADKATTGKTGRKRVEKRRQRRGETG